MDAIGNAPAVRRGRVFPDAQVVAKLEYMNPGGSIKDRAAIGIIKRADTLAGLAQILGIDAAALEASVSHWNAMCDAGADAAGYPATLRPYR